MWSESWAEQRNAQLHMHNIISMRLKLAAKFICKIKFMRTLFVLARCGILDFSTARTMLGFK